MYFNKKNYLKNNRYHTVKHSSQAATDSRHPLNVLHFVGHLSRWGLHLVQYCWPTHTTRINLLLLIN